MRFQLVIRPDGKAILVCPRDLRADEIETIREVWQHWEVGHPIIMVGDVVQVQDIELDLPDKLN